jgi:hypothetical protein
MLEAFKRPKSVRQVARDSKASVKSTSQVQTRLPTRESPRKQSPTKQRHDDLQENVGRFDCKQSFESAPTSCRVRSIATWRSRAARTLQRRSIMTGDLRRKSFESALTLVDGNPLMTSLPACSTTEWARTLCDPPPNPEATSALQKKMTHIGLAQKFQLGSSSLRDKHTGIPDERSNTADAFIHTKNHLWDVVLTRAFYVLPQKRIVLPQIGKISWIRLSVNHQHIGLIYNNTSNGPRF